MEQFSATCYWNIISKGKRESTMPFNMEKRAQKQQAPMAFHGIGITNFFLNQLTDIKPCSPISWYMVLHLTFGPFYQRIFEPLPPLHQPFVLSIYSFLYTAPSIYHYVLGPRSATVLQVKPRSTVLPVHDFPYIITACVFGAKIMHQLTLAKKCMYFWQMLANSSLLNACHI